jgi:phosphosulfolactate phosphohydrolase-like enzyme
MTSVLFNRGYFVQCEKYQNLKAQEKRLQEDHRIVREANAAPEESIEDWVKQGVLEGAYDEIVGDKDTIEAAAAYERTQGVPDDDGNLAESLREIRKAQRELWEEMQRHLLECSHCRMEHSSV